MKQQTLHRTIGRPLDETVATVDILAALKDLKAEAALEREGRNSIIFHKEEFLKVVLVAMRAGNEIRPHKAEVPITVQVIEGSIRFNTEKGSKQLNNGELLTLHAGAIHGVKALEDAAFLLTLAGPHGH
ncbi:MAG: cupin domain-containing protein [Elusimicrobia bacterium]|nr:cupin domain-containing protein [Elusimicrobiota bacterium]MDE2424840.1 cupin domain-containing protein [Elusimicrobiota bacterium]